MKFKFYIFFKIILLTFFISFESRTISLVYNLKIRRVFSSSAIFNKQSHKPIWLFSAVPIVYKRDRHIVNSDLLPIDICENRITGGSLLNLRYIPSKKWWLEVTTGIEKEHLKSCGTTNINVSRAGFDDIVFAGGYNFFPNPDSQIDIYALTGFPTKRTVSLVDAQDALVGTRFFSLGVGSEFSYRFYKDLVKSLAFVFQNRFLHFFTRSFFPVLPADAKLQPGNVTDLLFTIQYLNFSRFNLVEVGYNPTFFSNQAILLKTREIDSKWFVRNTIYANFMHLFIRCPGINKPIALGGGLNIGGSKKFNTKIFAAWLNLSLIF